MRRAVLSLFLLLTPLARADHATDLVRIHLEAIGGLKRVEALRSLRATGKVKLAGQEMETVVLAQAPNKVRIELKGGGANLVQAYDGSNPPWQYNDSEPGAQPRPIDGAAGREFADDADFIDPLITLVGKPDSIEYLGTRAVDGVKLEGLRVRASGRTELELWLDSRTYLLHSQYRNRTIAPGRTVRMESLFSDYRPLRGVMIPCRIRVLASGKLLVETRLERLEPNPGLDPKQFTPASISAY